MVTIRPLRDDDYAAAAEVMNATLLDSETLTGEQIRHADAIRSPAMRSARWVAELDGRVVGTASQLQYEDLYHPRKFWVMVRVHPGFQRRGIGAALYDTVLEQVRRYDPLALQVQVREDQTAGLVFAAHRGFVEYSRRWESFLELATFDPAPYADLETRLTRDGLTIRSVAELAADPDRDHKLHDLLWALDQDVPIDEPITPMSFTSFLTQVVQHPSFVAAGSFVALDGERYVGATILLGSPRSLNHDMTGALRDYRGRGLATLLKVRAARFAQANGYERMTATNDLSNAPMLAINARLGYTRLPAQLQLAKTFASEG